MTLREIVQQGMILGLCHKYTVEVVENKYGNKVFEARFSHGIREFKIQVTKNFIIYPFKLSRFGDVECEKFWNTDDIQPFELAQEIASVVEQLKAGTI